MKARKWLALLLSLVLLLGLLPGAALAADGEDTPAENVQTNSTSGSEETPTEGVTDSAAEDAQAAINEMQAKYAQIEAQLQAASEKYEPETVVAVADGREITWRLCYYIIGSLTSQFINYTMSIPDFSVDTGDGTTLQDAMRESVENRLVYYVAPQNEAEKRGLDEAVDAELEEQWQSMVEQLGGVDALAEAMEQAFLDEATYRFMLRSNAAFNAIMEDTYGANGEKLSDEDTLAWANDNGYLRCKHILFLTQNDDGTDMTDAQKEETKAAAEEVLAELRGLESDREALLARFDELMAEADDPGMTTFPDGYTFTEKQMVTEFEEGTRALDEYGLSDIVETNYGYHIILRLPLDPECQTMSQNSGTGEYMTLRADAANELFNAMLLEWIEEGTVEWQGDFGSLDYNELFAVSETEAEAESDPETGDSGFNENVEKDAGFYRNLGRALPYILIAVVVAVIAVVLTRKKKPAETVTEEAAAEEPEEAETEETPEEPQVEAKPEETAPETPTEEPETPETEKEEDE